MYFWYISNAKYLRILCLPRQLLAVQSVDTECSLYVTTGQLQPAYGRWEICQ